MLWTGRHDGDEPLYHRIWQRALLCEDYAQIQPEDFVLHGFAVDEGVKRNQGRPGAHLAPDILRKSIANFPVTQPHFVLRDFGNVDCRDGDLEKAQKKLAEKVARVFAHGAKSVVFGGGHEVMYAQYSGLRAAFPEKKIGIINIDAHFDNRAIVPGQGASSGTGFWQIAEAGPIHSLHIGIQKNSNTLRLFDYAHQKKMQYILADEVFFENLPALYEKLDRFCSLADVLYVTICMDTFNAAIAPGVSAPAYNGLFADPAFMHLFRRLLDRPNLRALDVAEVNPHFDIDNRTARLAAGLVNEWLQNAVTE